MTVYEPMPLCNILIFYEYLESKDSLNNIFLTMFTQDLIQYRFTIHNLKPNFISNSKCLLFFAEFLETEDSISFWLTFEFDRGGAQFRSREPRFKFNVTRSELIVGFLESMVLNCAHSSLGRDNSNEIYILLLYEALPYDWVGYVALVLASGFCEGLLHVNGPRHPNQIFSTLLLVHYSSPYWSPLVGLQKCWR